MSMTKKELRKIIGWFQLLDIIGSALVGLYVGFTFNEELGIICTLLSFIIFGIATTNYILMRTSR